MNRSLFLLALLIVLIGRVHAQIVPEIGDNVVRAGDPPPGQIVAAPPPGAVPAIVDLGSTSDNPTVRRFAAAWIQRTIDEVTFSANTDSIMVALIDARGEIVAAPTRLASYPQSGSAPTVLGNPAIVVSEGGFFSVLWSVVEGVGDGSDFEQTVYARTFWPEPDDGSVCPADGLSPFAMPPFDPDGPQPVMLRTDALPELSQPGIRQLTQPRLSIDADAAPFGRTVFAFSDHRVESDWGIFVAATDLVIDVPEPDPLDRCTDDYARLVPPGSAVLISAGAEYQAAPRVAVEPNTGRSVVVWRNRDARIQAQRIDATGVPVGEKMNIASSDSIQVSVHGPDVAYEPSGFFRVVWERNRYRSPDSSQDARSEILMSRFDRDGNVAESNVLVDVDAGTQFSSLQSLRNPRIVTRDLDGDFAVAWDRRRGECPFDFNSVESWGIDSQTVDCQLANGRVFRDVQSSGHCSLRMFSSAPRPSAECRVRVRLRPVADDVPIQGIALREDEQIHWDDFNADERFSVDFAASRRTFNSCAFLDYPTPYGGRTLLLEQACEQINGSGCVSCAQQSQRVQQLLASAAATEEPPVDASTAPEHQPERGGVFAGGDIWVRWFYRNYGADEATPVAPFRINDRQDFNQPPAIGMGFDSDMLVGWLGNDFGPGGPDGLITQNLAGPVELSINDIGILEGPLIRATANFTVSASKPYPGLGSTCPEPSLSLLTADGTASFLTNDYTRTTGSLGFGTACDQSPRALAFSVPVEDDDVFEDTESFFVDLFDEQNAIVVRRQGVGAIVDNDLPATVMAPETIVEVCEDGNPPDNSGGPRCPLRTPKGFVELTVMLDDPQEVEGSVEFQTFDGSAFGDIGAAVAGQDYEGVTGELQFLPGNQVGFLSINLIDSGIAELKEQFFVELIGAEGLTLPDEPALRQVTVQIIDDDTCSVAPQWFLPDPDAIVAEEVAAAGPEVDRTGYFCVVNPDGFGDCPWQSRLALNEGEEPWLGLTDIPWSDPPADLTTEELADAQAACTQVPDATGSIRYIAEENLPNAANQNINGRTQTVEFVNGELEPPRRDVTQEGGNCRPRATPGDLDFFPVGGSAPVQVGFSGQSACESFSWTASVDSGARDWLRIEGASSDGSFNGSGPGGFEIDVDPYAPSDGVVEDRIGIINIGGTPVRVVQEAPFFDHFDDDLPPDPTGWIYVEPNAWSESGPSGTRLTASTLGRAEVVASPAFAGCTTCLVETDLRFDSFGKGRATVYMWWNSEQDFLALTADEFFDSWTLTQRVDGVDHVLREFTSDLLVGIEYAVRMEYTDELGGPLVLVDVGGQPMCPAPGPGVEPCSPYDPDPADPDVPPVIGGGTVGYAVDQAVVSFDRLRVIRSDALAVPVGTLFSDSFESD